MGKNRTNEILLSTENGLLLCHLVNGLVTIADHYLEGQSLTCIAAPPGKFLAGTRSGILLSDDGGRSWKESSVGMDIRHVRCIASHTFSGRDIFAGTEPAAVYVSRDGGATWSFRRDVEEMRDRLGWYLPYSPEAGCIRSFAFDGKRVFAAAEVGGVLRSDDGGDSWFLVGERDGTSPPAGPAADDVHAVLIHLLSPGLVFAATGGGLFRSIDAGNSWIKLYDCYCRAVWLDPLSPHHLIFSPATKKGWHGSIIRSRDGGENWEPAENGLDLPWPGKMIEGFLQVGKEIVALRSDGLLYSASAGDLRWERVLPEVERVTGMTHLSASL